MLVKWFPDKRGLITGVAVGGFGAGALVTAPVATRLIQSVGVLHTFAYLGVAYLIVTMITGWFMQNPPAGMCAGGMDAERDAETARAATDYYAGRRAGTWQWWALWLALFLNTTAGISVISQESPMFQEIAKVTAIVAAEHGGHCEHRQRRGPRLLGVGFRRDYAALDVRGDVPVPGRAFPG